MLRDLEGLLAELNEKGDFDGYVLDAAQLASGGQSLQIASEHRTVLSPQPSDDPNDPLKRSSSKKHLLLFAVLVAAFLLDFASSIAIVTLLPQAM